MTAFEAEDKDAGVLGDHDWLMMLKRDYVPVFAGLLSKILPKEIVAEITHKDNVFTLNMIGLEPKRDIEHQLPSLARIGVDDEVIEGQVTSE